MPFCEATAFPGLMLPVPRFSANTNSPHFHQTPAPPTVAMANHARHPPDNEAVARSTPMPCNPMNAHLVKRGDSISRGAWRASQGSKRCPSHRRALLGQWKQRGTAQPASNGERMCSNGGKYRTLIISPLRVVSQVCDSHYLSNH
jgi:hypothetical protein